MNFSQLSAEITAQALQRVDELRGQYSGAEEIEDYWAMVDLVSSSAYRAIHGESAAYYHTELLLSVVDMSVRPYSSSVVMKEMGDGAILHARSFRELLEPLLLIRAVSSLLSARSPDAQHFMAVRAGVTFGPTRKLLRTGREDYLGSAIDRLARVAAWHSDQSRVLLSKEVATPANRTVISEYQGLTLGKTEVIPESVTKSGSPVHIYPLLIDDGKLAECSGQYRAWNASER